MQTCDNIDADQTRQAECLPRFESLKAAGRPVQWHVYPNAAHSWDYAQFVPARQMPLG